MRSLQSPSARNALVDIESRRVECFRRNTENHWVLYDFEGEMECEFASIGFSMPLAEVFEDVDADNLPSTTEQTHSEG